MRKSYFDYTKKCELVDANSMGVSVITTGDKKLNVSCKALKDEIQSYVDATKKAPQVVLIGKAVFEAIDQEIGTRFGGNGTVFRGSTLVCNMFKKEIPILGIKGIPENAIYFIGDLIQEGFLPEPEPTVVHEEEI